MKNSANENDISLYSIYSILIPRIKIDLNYYFFRRKWTGSSSKNCGQGGKYKTQQNLSFITPKRDFFFTNRSVQVAGPR